LLNADVPESLDSDNGDECDAVVMPGPGVLYSAVTAVSNFLKHPFGSQNVVPGRLASYCSYVVTPDVLAYSVFFAVTECCLFTTVAESADERKQFHERTISEKEVILEQVADELARIADSYNAEYAKL
jgi:hypothetical protein